MSQLSRATLRSPYSGGATVSLNPLSTIHSKTFCRYFCGGLFVRHETERLYTVPEKKQNVFCNICYNTRAIWWKSAYSFLHKFAAKLCKLFHLTWITYPHHLVKLEMLVAYVLPLSCYRQKLENLSHLNCVLKIRQIWIQLITACGRYCQRRCRKHASLIWSYQRRYWWMAAAMTTCSSLAHSVLSRCFSSFKSVINILYTFSCNTPHTM